jgi:hypothetical protein
MDELHPPCTYTGWRYALRNDSLLSESDAMKRHLSTPVRHADAIQVNLSMLAFFAIAAFLLLLRTHLPDLKVRVVNVVDLMTLQPREEHPHGLTDREFDGLFTTDKPIIFAYHGYPWLIHRLTYRRTNHRNLHVRGYKEAPPRRSTWRC